MAYGQLLEVRGEDRDVVFASVPQYWDGLLSQPKFKVTDAGEVIFSYDAPWNADGTELLFWNLLEAQGSYNYNTGRGCVELNHLDASGAKNLRFVLKNGTQIICQGTSPQCQIISPLGVTIAQGNPLAAPGTYVNYLYCIIDYANLEAIIGYYYLDPRFDGSESRYGGWNIVGNLDTSQTARQNLYNALYGNEPVQDPYLPGGTSTTGGGSNATWDDTSDTISVPGAPALNLTLNHFISAYVPSLTDVNNLANFVWGNYDKTDSSKVLSKILANPSDAIVSLHMLPYTPDSSTAIEVTIGQYGTSVSMPPMTSQFKDIDCGSVTISPYWDNYLDYTATHIILFLPYVGEVTLDVNEVMGQTVSVLYRVDNLTGAFVCFVSTSDKILGQYNGCCALSVPVSSADYRGLNQAILNAAAAAVGGVMTAAGAGAALATGAAEGAIGSLNLAAGGISAAANVAQSKVHHSRSGALGGAAGFLGSQTPYVIIHRARQCLPEGLNKRAGYPAMITKRLGDLHGFTSVSSIIMDGLAYTDAELSELAEILKEGIII